MEQSKSEILRDWIKQKLDDNYNYASKENRTQDFAEFVNSHKEFDAKADKPLYHAILKKEIVRKGLDLRTFGLTPQRPNFPESDMTGSTTFAPAIIRRMPVVKEAKTEELEDKDNTASTQTQDLANFTVESVGLTVKFMFNFLKLKYPFLESLTKEEQEALGQVWLPIFKKYLEKNWAMWGVAVFSTMSIMSTKIKDAKDKAKNQNSDKKSDEVRL